MLDQISRAGGRLGADLEVLQRSNCRKVCGMQPGSPLSGGRAVRGAHHDQSHRQRPKRQANAVHRLSFGTLDKFRAEPLDTYIRIDGDEVGLPVDVMIFSGETEAAMAKMIEPSLTPDAKVHINKRLKN
jgi:hypothetical protein